MVYHGPLLSHLFIGSCAIYFHHGVICSDKLYDLKNRPWNFHHHTSSQWEAQFFIVKNTFILESARNPNNSWEKKEKKNTGLSVCQLRSCSAEGSSRDSKSPLTEAVPWPASILTYTRSSLATLHWDGLVLMMMMRRRINHNDNDDMPSCTCQVTTTFWQLRPFQDL